MAATQRFRSAFNGFNREDVVNYIEYINNQFNAKLEQMQHQLDEARANNTTDVVDALQLQLAEATQRCKELEEKLATMESKNAEKELEAYRRAERTERQAKERARQICDQAGQILTDATDMAQSAAQQINQMADGAIAQLRTYQTSICDVADRFREAAETLKTIHPSED